MRCGPAPVSAFGFRLSAFGFRQDGGGAGAVAEQQRRGIGTPIAFGRFERDAGQNRDQDDTAGAEVRQAGDAEARFGLGGALPGPADRYGLLVRVVPEFGAVLA